MMDVYLTMKINTRLVSLTDPRLMIAFLAMSVVRQQKRFAWGMLRSRTVPREFSQKMRGVWVPISL
jgi:hypothetical protein